MLIAIPILTVVVNLWHAKLKRFTKAVLNLGSDDLRRLDFPHIVEQDRKLIPTQAGNDVARPQATIQSARHDFQETDQQPDGRSCR